MSTRTILIMTAFIFVGALVGCAGTDKNGASYDGKNIGEVLGKSDVEVVFYLGTPIDGDKWGLIASIDDKLYEVDPKGLLNGPKLLHIRGGDKNGEPYRYFVVGKADMKKFLELQKDHTKYLGSNISKAVADKGMPVAAVGYDITTDKRLMGMGGGEAAEWFAAQGKMRSAAVAKITFADGSAFLVDSAGTIVFED